METLFSLVLVIGSLVAGDPIHFDDTGRVDVIWVQGDVSVSQVNQQTRNVLPGDSLPNEVMVSIAKGDSITLLTSTRHLITLAGPRDVELSSLLESDLSANHPRLERAWVRDRVAQWPEIGLSERRRKERGSLMIRSPRAMAISAKRPWITWVGPESLGGGELTLKVLRANGTYRNVETWRNIRTRRFKFSSPLREGRFYRLILRHGTETDETMVYMLTRSEKQALLEAEQQLNRLFGSLDLPVPVRTMIMARWLDDHGLFDRAAQWWAELARAHPDVKSFKREVERHQNRELVTSNEFLSLTGTTQWLLDLFPIFLPIR